MRAWGDVAGKYAARTHYGSRIAKFGKHIMLLYVHGMHALESHAWYVGFTRPPALQARQTYRGVRSGRQPI
jgi:hypothetical protein